MRVILKDIRNGTWIYVLHRSHVPSIGARRSTGHGYKGSKKGSYFCR